MEADMRLRRDVQAALDWDPRFDARDIAVSVKDGVVTLIGKVSSFAEKNAAEEATQVVRGVAAIANEIEIALQEAAKRDDSHIAAAALAALRAHASIPADDIKVIVRNGWITLEGEVCLRFQHDTAEMADTRKFRATLRARAARVARRDPPSAATLRRGAVCRYRRTSARCGGRFIRGPHIDVNLAEVDRDLRSYEI